MIGVHFYAILSVSETLQNLEECRLIESTFWKVLLCKRVCASPANHDKDPPRPPTLGVLIFFASGRLDAKQRAQNALLNSE